MDSRVRALYKIEIGPKGPAQARRIIAQELSAILPPADLDAIKLMVSELVTNGVVHGRGHSADPLHGRGQSANSLLMLDLRVNGDIRCGVLDRAGPGFAARVGRSERWGWALRLFEALADRWGMQCSPRLTEVWFERTIDVTRGPAPTRSGR